MPRGDGTGPLGAGPMTGRAAGYCAGYSVPGYLNPGPGLGLGMAWGWGRGRGRGFRWRTWGLPAYPANVPASVPGRGTEALKSQAEYLEQALKNIRERISELESSGEDR